VGGCNDGAISGAGLGGFDDGAFSAAWFGGFDGWAVPAAENKMKEKRTISLVFMLWFLTRMPEGASLHRRSGK
jgi:hypothetical protein